MEETLKLIKAKLGPEHPHTLKTMNNLANSYCDAGKPDLALPLLEEALKLQKAKLGADHPDLLTTMNNLAMAYKDAGKMDLALPLLEASLKLSKARLGADDPETIISVNNSALIYLDAGMPDLALPLLQEAAWGVEKLRFRHQNAGRIVANLIACHERLKQFNQAGIWRRKWLAVLKERNGADSRPYATELMALGYTLLQQKEWIAAEPVLRECLSIVEEKQPGRSITFNTQGFLGASLSGQAKYTEAEPLLLKAYEGLAERARANPDPARATNMQQTAAQLIQLYEAWGKPTQAAEWRQKQRTP
jgi:tetratricopeptide (TPR) repeat protein